MLTARHKQTDITENNTTVAARVVIMKEGAENAGHENAGPICKT